VEIFVKSWWQYLKTVAYNTKCRKKSFILSPAVWLIVEQDGSRRTEVGSYPEGTRLNPWDCPRDISGHSSGSEVDTDHIRLEAKIMELSYRGVGYTHSPATVTVSPGKVGGRYRGLDWRFRHLSKPVVLPTKLDLLYRGAAYRSEAAAAPAQTVQTAEAPAPGRSHVLDELARRLMMGHQRAIRVRQQAMLVRGTERVGLQANVRNFWNRIQGKVHPTFRLTYDRSRVSMS
jgi:hypothetical protein